MEVLNCRSCGAPLPIDSENGIAICEYCGTANQTDGGRSPDGHADSSVRIASIAAYGSTIFQKKLFCIYGEYAELVDEATGRVDKHIDYCNIVRHIFPLGINIYLQMRSGEQITIRCIWSKDLQLSLQIFDRLI